MIRDWNHMTLWLYVTDIMMSLKVFCLVNTPVAQRQRVSLGLCTQYSMPYLYLSLQGAVWDKAGNRMQTGRFFPATSFPHSPITIMTAENSLLAIYAYKSYINNMLLHGRKKKRDSSAPGNTWAGLICRFHHVIRRKIKNKPSKSRLKVHKGLRQKEWIHTSMGRKLKKIVKLQTLTTSDHLPGKYKISFVLLLYVFTRTKLLINEGHNFN